MQAFNTLFPVFFMIVLGLVSRLKGWITPEQKEGAKKVVFSILFPFLIFNAIFSAQLKSEYVAVILYVLVVFVLALGVGAILRKWYGEEYKAVAPYMLSTVEGGNVALPLYITIVGSAYMVNTVMFDIAGSIVAFLIIPIIVAKQTSDGGSVGDLIKTMMKNSFIIAIFLAIVGNLTGIYGLLEQSAFFDLYTGTVSMVTGPIGGIILFVIGYDLSVDVETLPVLIKLTVTRLIFYVLVIAGFFVLFSDMMANREFKIGVLLYFLCPTGFAMPIIVSPLCESEKQSSFMSAFLSLYMIITLIVYTVLVITM